MKSINKQQIESILQLLAKYNVGVQEYQSVVKLFETLPEVNEEKNAETTKGGETDN